MTPKRSPSIIIIIIIITSGFGDSWPYKHNRHRIPIRAGPQIDERDRLTRSHVGLHVSFPAGLPGGPAIQFGGPHRIGLVPLQPTLFLTLDFNPRIYTTAVKKIIIIIIIILVLNHNHNNKAARIIRRTSLQFCTARRYHAFA